jgi:D-alanyl-D-alanine carboxypeptidase
MVPEEYSVELGSYSGYKMAKHIISPLKQMLADCKAAGHTAVVSSAYRSHGDQIYLHNRRIQRFLDQGYSEEEAKLEAARRVAVPGTSEHELGLALDIVDSDYRNLTEEQESMPAQKWLIENSWKYGFILRYPNNKSDVTGIIYEPWHYRYVGKELAKELHDSGLCLEEYFSQLTVK